jgi:hypothetical protein
MVESGNKQRTNRKNETMKSNDKRKGDMLSRILQYEEDHAVTPPIPRATVLFAKAATLSTALTNHGGTQTYGKGGYRAGATERKALAKDLRTFLVDMSATAQGLEYLHPGIKDQFRLGTQSKSHQQLLSTAQAFLTAVTPADVKQLFTDRAFPADLDVQLTTKMAALTTAVSRRSTGKLSWKQGTVSLDVLSREITVTMRELRALMVKHLRDTDPTLLEVWKAAARSYAPPVAAEAAPAPAEQPAGS